MKPLDLWRLHDDLTIKQATHLIIGMVPNEIEHDETIDDLKGWYSQSEKVEFAKQYDAISNALKNALQREQIQGDLIPAVIRYGDGDNPSERTEPHDASRLEVSSLKQWLLNKGLRPSFFFPESQETADYLDPTHPRFSPKLAAAVRAWQAIGEKASGKSPKRLIEQWLKDNATLFGLKTRSGQPNVSAIEDIAKIVNWRPQGGAPKTPVK